MEQVRPQPCSHVDRQGRQGESLARVVGPHVGGYVEHSADAESDLSLLFRWECLTECDICERLRLGRPTGSEQRHRGTGHQRAAERMSRRGEVERLLREVSGRGGVGHSERFCCLQERGDGVVVARFRALGQLRRDLYRKGPPFKEHPGRSAVRLTTRPLLLTRFSSFKPRRSSTSKNGLPAARSAAWSTPSPGLAPSTSAAIWVTASLSMGPSEIRWAPPSASSVRALTIGTGPSRGRIASTQEIGSVLRHCGSVRRAAAVPLSAHWRSSRQTMSGVSIAARSRSDWTSW